MEFGVLGPVEVWRNGRTLDAGHARQRAVLVVLLLDLGRAVPLEALIDRVWGEDAPRSVRNVVYGYVARLKALIAAAQDPGISLSRRPGGYLLQAGPEQVDVCRFGRLVADAAAVTDDERAGALLHEAVGLWRGPALAGLDSPWLNGQRARLELERAAAVLDLGDIRLRRGEHHALAGELAGQAAATPADERLVGQLMLALYRCGRQAEALRWYEQTRLHLAGELGADPGPDLQDLHQQMLRADPALAAPGHASVSSRGGSVPRELPADVPSFTARAAELAELDRLLAAPAGDRRVTAAVISAVSGTAGVGKTALAVHWAHQAAGRFPDGQLYVNLRGYDPDRPVTPADALAGFLRSLGVPGQDIPPGEDQRAARYRSLLAGGRMLVVLDNASEVEQVRPLLPGTPACVVLVTSRESLAGLVARHGAARLDLDLLPLKDAVGLLRALIGVRVDADPDAAGELAAYCCRLPLALRVAAELAAARPGVPLATLVSELADQQRRLDLLDADGDRRTAVRAVFSWSYRSLGASTARAFRLAGLHPGPDFDPYAVAALAATTVEEARQALDLVARAHLIRPARPGRYGMHDLLRAYARALAEAPDGEGGAHTALTRLFDYYLHAAATAMDTLVPAERHRRPRIPPPVTPAPLLTNPGAAQTWLDAERSSLVAMAAHTAEHGWPSYATRLAATLYRYLDAGGHHPEAAVLYGHARRAARDSGDRAAEATALTNLAVVDLRQGRYQQATSHLRQSLALHRQTGDRTGEARALQNLALVCFQQGRYQQATSHLEQSLALHRQTGDRSGELRALGNLGLAYLRQGRNQHATSHLEQSLALSRQTGDRTSEARALANLGDLYGRQGRYQHATGHLQHSLALSRQIGDRNEEIQALARLGDVEQRQGLSEQATAHHQQALELCCEIGDRSGEAEAHNGLGDVLIPSGRPRDARARHATALGLAVQIGDKYQQARAHDGLGHACQALGEAVEARRHWQEALALYADLGVPEADQVRAHLSQLTDELVGG